MEQKPLFDDDGEASPVPQGKVGTLFVQAITNLDCAVFEPSNGIIGQTWLVDVEVSGHLNEQGFVADFSHLKKLVRELMKEHIDHALLIPVSSQSVHFSDLGNGEEWRLHALCKLNDTDFRWEYRCPRGAVYPMRTITLKLQNVEQEVARLIKHRLPETVQDVNVRLREEQAEPTAAFFRYTHGITRHSGLCQRLFHGHRSRVEVYVGEERRPDLEHFVSRELLGGDVHIMSDQQLVEGNLRPGERGQAGETIGISYEAAQGIFEAKLPADRVFMVRGETSIECIAQEVAAVLRAKEKRRLPIKVMMYEGLHKGAIARS